MSDTRYTKDGMVAVLYSRGFGAGWSSWADDDKAEAMMFHPELVKAALGGEKDIEPLLQSLFGDDAPYSGGWGDIGIEWVEPGSRIEIDEYDGSESVRILSPADGYVA